MKKITVIGESNAEKDIEYIKEVCRNKKKLLITNAFANYEIDLDRCSKK